MLAKMVPDQPNKGANIKGHIGQIARVLAIASCTVLEARRTNNTELRAVERTMQNGVQCANEGCEKGLERP